MKWKKKALIILCAAAVLFFISGCGNKTAITADDFKSKMEEKGFTVTDMTSQSNTEKLSSALLAQSEDNSYQIQFLVLDSEDTSVSTYNNAAESIKSQTNANVKTETTTNHTAHIKYVTSEKIYDMSRIDNTILYSVASADKQDEVENIFEELGY